MYYNPTGKNLEKQYRVPFLINEGVHVVGPAENFPLTEATFVCFCTGGNNPSVDLLLHKDEISAECICGLRATSLQDRSCGYVELK